MVKERVQRGTSEEIIHDVPGGGIEFGESIEETLHREVREEVGLEISIGQPVGGWHFIIQNGEQHSSVHIVCFGYQCELVGEPKIDTSRNPAQEDIFETVWLTKEEVLTLPIFQTNLGLRAAVEKLHITDDEK